MQVGKLVKDLQVGDLVVRTYGEGQRPTGLIIGLYGHGEYCYSHTIAEIVWTGSTRATEFETKFLKVISASR
jgi:hypothetical protein